MSSPTGKKAAGSVVVSTGSTALVAANGNRGEVFITNDHAANVVYLALGATAELNKGIRLNAAGGGVVITGYSGAISAIATAGSTTVTFAEV